MTNIEASTAPFWEGTQATIVVRASPSFCAIPGVHRNASLQWVMISPNLFAAPGQGGYAQVGYFQFQGGSPQNWAQYSYDGNAPYVETFGAGVAEGSAPSYSVYYDDVDGSEHLAVNGTTLENTSFNPFCPTSCGGWFNQTIGTGIKTTWVSHWSAETYYAATDIPGTILAQAQFSSMAAQACCTDQFRSDWSTYDSANPRNDFPGRWANSGTPLNNVFSTWTSVPLP
jgi:hypothetical protein